MADVYNPRVLRVTIRGRLDGQLINYVFHAARPVDSPLSTWTAPQAAVAAERIYGAFVNRIMPSLAIEHTVDGVSARVLSGPAGVTVDGNTIPASGTVVGGAMPNNVALAVTWITSVGGRSGRGRTFLAGIPRSVVQASRVTETYRVDLTAECTQFIFEANASDAQLVVYSKFNAKVPRPVGEPYGILSAQIRDAVLDSQRRRLPGRGL